MGWCELYNEITSLDLAAVCPAHGKVIRYHQWSASFSPRGTLIFMSADEFLRLHNYLILCPLTNSILPLFINFLIHVDTCLFMHRQYINSVWSRKWNLVNHLSYNYYLVQYY